MNRLKEILIDGKYGVTDERHRVIIPNIYDYITFGLSFSCGGDINYDWIIGWENPCFEKKIRGKRVVYRPVDGKTTLYNAQGKRIRLLYHNKELETILFIQRVFDLQIRWFQVTCIIDAQKRVGIIDDKGNIIVPFDYEYVYPLDIDRTIYDSQTKQPTPSFFIVGNNIVHYAPGKGRGIEKGNFGVISINLETIVSQNYDYIFPTTREFDDEQNPFCGDFIKVRKDGKEGVLSYSGQIILPPIYSYVEIHNEAIRFYYGGVHSKINEHPHFYKNWVEGGKWGVYERNSRLQTAAEFDAVLFADNNDCLAIVVRNGEPGSLSTNLRVMSYEGMLSKEKILEKSNILYEYDDIEEPYYEDWTKEDIEAAYRGAYEGMRDAQWNTD